MNTVELEAAESVWSELSADDGLDHYITALRDCLQRLRERSRQVVSLHYAEGLTRAAIDEELERRDTWQGKLYGLHSSA